MIYIGSQTAKSASPVFAPFAYARARGFSAFEWFADTGENEAGEKYGWDFSRVDAAGRSRLRAEGVRFSVHAAWNADPRTEDGARAVRAALEFADAAGAPVAVAHMLRERAEIPAFARALAALMAGYSGNAKLAVENTPDNSPADFNALFAELGKLPGGEKIGMAFDLGHANCCAATRNDYIRFLNGLSPAVAVIHCHVHENWGDADSHLPLFSGASAQNDAGIRMFAAILKNRGFSGSLIMEQWPQPPEMLDAAAARLREICESAGLEVAPFLPAAEQPAGAYAWTAGDFPRPGGEPAAAEPAAKPAENPTARAAAPAPEVPDMAAAAATPPVPEKPAAPEISPAAENPAARAVPPLPAAGREKTAGLAARAAAAARRHTSWRTRLEWVGGALRDGEFTASPEALAVIAALLRFIAAGELPCAEDGGHYRPCHHAAAAAEIENALEKPGIPEWLRRRIYPFLPSHATAYRAAEPLTRIRDIAHRNDIPKDLKLHIKHDLQNKLHRSAGPEDLRTAREIFARITAPGASYSRDFVEQFRIFMGELERFFNSPDLSARLDAVSREFPDLAPACREVSSAGARPAGEQAAAAVELRRRLAEKLASAAPESRQALRLADIELENFAFARLSAAAGDCPGARACDAGWFALFRAALENAALSESDVPETAVLAAEAAAWEAGFNPDDPLHLARLRATALRTLRAGAAYQAKIAEIFLPAALALGRELGIGQAALDAFGEGAIRAGVMFQPVKLAEGAEAWLRARLGLPPWGVIVPGTARGVALDAETLDTVPEGADPAVVRLTSAAGDEEIPARVRGIVLAHPLPHLSHLAIRARQAGVVLAAAENDEEFAALGAENRVVFESPSRAAAAPWVELSATARGVGVRAADACARAEGAPDGLGARAGAPAAISLMAEPRALRDGEITRETGGAKAAGAGWLLGQASAAGAGFRAPAARALPFGSMEKALALAGKTAEYGAAVAGLAGLSEAELVSRLPELREIIMGLEVPAAWLRDLTAGDAPGTRYAVRSSSNGEDLENLAGAGLYDSVVGVPAENLAAAVKQVWASLWTRRAALSRRHAGLPQDAVRMAVLVQEALAPDYSFVLHTADPVSGERGRVGVEIAVGLGETLASANQPGRPYRLSVPADGAPRLFSCADYSFAARAGQNAGGAGELAAERLDYARVPLSRDAGALTALAERLGGIGRALDAAAARALDIEGAVCGGEIYIVQARPQTGLAAG